MEYTKGKWIADSGDSELWGIFQEEDCQGIAYLCEPNGTLLRPEEAKANAQLIAQAPRMYEALLAVYNDIELQNVEGGSDELNIQVQQALTKAEGGER